MTVKQIQILQATTELFLELGYHATTSKKIAAKAQVSEGLIFRHFIDKQGLLKAVASHCDASLAPIIYELQFIDNIKYVLIKVIELPRLLHSNDYNSLQLLFKLQYELKKDYSKSLTKIKNLLEKVFEQLYYKQPKLEIELLIYYLNGMTNISNSKSEDHLKQMENFILSKYHLN